MHMPRPTWSRIGGTLVALALALSPLSPTLAWAADAVDKSETVHVETDASGTITTITVEELLANGSGSSELVDHTELSDIVPSEDELTYATGDDGTITWAAGGKDVSYEGASTSEPPVKVAVSYTLDGTPQDPAQLAGASGHLVVRVDYENTVSSLRNIDGTETRVYTPFVCMTAAILDNEVFRNVTVENGKVVDDKGGLAIIGYALPGLRESLDLDPDELDLDFPEYLQFEADVTDLTMDPLYTIVTPELFTDLDTSDLSFDDFGEGTDELESAMGELINGSSTLTDGLHQIADGSDQLGNGILALREALGQLPSGLTQLATGAQTLSDRLGEAAEVAATLSEGASGLSEGAAGAQQLVGAAQECVGAAQGSVGALKETVEALGLDGAKPAASEAAGAAGAAQGAATEAKQLIEGQATKVSEQKDVVAGDLEAAQGTLATLLDDETLGLTAEQRTALEGKLATASGQLAAAQTGLAALDASVPEGLNEQAEALGGAASTLARDAELIGAAEGKMGTVTTGADEALGALGEASASLDTAGAYVDGVAQGARDIAAGTTGISTGLDAAATGAQTLAETLGAVGARAPQALSGIDALATGSGQLTSAISAAAEGSDLLTTGLSTFDDEGISKIVDALDDLDHDLTGTADRLDALREAAREYDIFAGKAEGASSSVRFIYKTERIG